MPWPLTSAHQLQPRSPRPDHQTAPAAPSGRHWHNRRGSPRSPPILGRPPSCRESARGRPTDTGSAAPGTRPGACGATRPSCYSTPTPRRSAGRFRWGRRCSARTPPTPGAECRAEIDSYGGAGVARDRAEGEQQRSDGEQDGDPPSPGPRCPPGRPGSRHARRVLAVTAGVPARHGAGWADTLDEGDERAYTALPAFPVLLHGHRRVLSDRPRRPRRLRQLTAALSGWAGRREQDPVDAGKRGWLKDLLRHRNPAISLRPIRIVACGRRASAAPMCMAGRTRQPPGEQPSPDARLLRGSSLRNR